MRTCSLCDKKHYAKGYCEAHYKQYRESLSLNIRKCTIVNCQEPHYGWNLCRRHYKTEHRRRHRSLVKNTPEYRLEKNLRNRHNQAITKAVSKSHPIKHLGCTISDLKTHIESLFHNDPINGQSMTWDNRGLGSGKWQIDHEISFSSIDLSNAEEQLKVCHYTNLRPMWYEEHQVKSSLERRIK